MDVGQRVDGAERSYVEARVTSLWINRKEIIERAVEFIAQVIANLLEGPLAVIEMKPPVTSPYWAGTTPITVVRKTECL